MPSFIACCARSGSTLLRWLVDAHPEVTCPGETDLAVLVSNYVSIATGLSRPGEDLVSIAGGARRMADELMARHLGQIGKQRWCEKSLSNVFHLDLLASLWPDARFVLLHRHCMDMIMSGLDASPWGLAEYGFAQVAQRSPTDSVGALAAYWVDRTSRLLDFEERFADRCLRLRYEDMVVDPESALDRTFRHLGVDPIDRVAAAGFATTHRGIGPADHTIWYTDRVHEGAVGKGARVPPGRVTGVLRTTVNDLLARLDYATVDDTWGSGGMALPIAEPVILSSGQGLVELRIMDGHQIVARQSMGLDLPDDPAGGENTQAPSSQRPAAVVAIEQAVAVGLCDGSQNLGAALRARAVRYYGLPIRHFEQERAVFDQVIGHLREGVRHGRLIKLT